MSISVTVANFLTDWAYLCKSPNAAEVPLKATDNTAFTAMPRRGRLDLEKPLRESNFAREAITLPCLCAAFSAASLEAKAKRDGAVRRLEPACLVYEKRLFLSGLAPTPCRGNLSGVAFTFCRGGPPIEP